MKLLVTGGSGFIGTNLIPEFKKRGDQLLNLDIQPPLDPAQTKFWRKADILEKTQLAGAFAEFEPEWVIHLAARADCDENTTVEKGYRVNTEGTTNVLEVIRATPSVQRVIITSSQFVCGPGPLPKNDEDYFPDTVYGRSKVITEQLTRQANLACCWTIIRPTNVWGPWHLRYRREFWRIVERGLYVHPGRQPVIRSYGYVKNVIDQIRCILELPNDSACGKTFYLGDLPANLIEWVDAFSRALTGRPVRIVPRPLMRALALLGDIPTAITGRPFYINSSRYRSMITEYPTPMSATFQLLGTNPCSLMEGVNETVAWLHSYNGPDGASGGA
jgi:nucleoside-diphosphate-sugar epimerase